MKYCFQCGRTTSGEPLFCNFCGRTFDVKLCPRLHPNPRIAKVCSQCGSHDLSEPQPKVSWVWRLIASLIRLVAGVLLAGLSILIVITILRQLVTRPEFQAGMLVMGILVFGLWCLWTMLPQWLRKLVRRLVTRRKRRDDR
jgi:hypothetical protein